MTSLRTTSRGQVLAALLGVLPLVACVSLPWYQSQGAQVSSVPRWTCPTPTPQPYGEAGPIKGYDTTVDPTSGIATEVPLYYEQWERENFDGGGAPFPSPTAEVREGTSFLFGQLVNLSPDLDVRADVRATTTVTNGSRLIEALVRIVNRGTPITITPARQIVVSAIRRTDGGRVAGNGWSWSADAEALAGRTGNLTLTVDVPAGEQNLVVPILIPDGEVQTLDLQLDVAGQGGSGALRVQWQRPTTPAMCATDGVAGASYSVAARPADVPPAPANASDVVQWAYTQLGRPYCWGGKGYTPCDGYGGGPSQVTPSCDAQGGYPCWDCSGLTWGAYNAVGVTIGQGTANQSRYPAVWQAGDSTAPASVAQPGDLLLFTGMNANGRPAGRITHVGIYAGDGLLIHAASPKAGGVIATPNVFTNRYYQPLLVRITRPPRT